MKQPEKLAAHHWRSGGRVEVVGPDAFSYLQSQVSNDLRELKDGGLCYALLLNRKGGIRADFIVEKCSAEHWSLFTPGFSPQALASYLEENIIADEVEVAVADTVSRWCLWQPEGIPAPSGWPGRDAPSVFEPTEGLRIFPGYIGRFPHWFIEGTGTPEKVLSTVMKIWGHIRQATEGEFLRDRLRYAAFLLGVDGGEGTLPQEYGLEQIAVSFRKGCFLGQEVMARLKAMGQVQWTLVSGSVNAVPEGTLPLNVLAEDGKAAGTLLVREGSLALARVRRRFSPNGTCLNIESTNSATFQVTGPAGWNVH